MITVFAVHLFDVFIAEINKARLEDPKKELNSFIKDFVKDFIYKHQDITRFFGNLRLIYEQLKSGSTGPRPFSNDYIQRMASIANAQHSPKDLAIIYYYCYYDSEFKELIDPYNVFKHMDKRSLLPELQT